MSPAVTTSTYALKGSDWGHTISVSVTASKLGYNNYTLNHSASVDYSIVPNAAPTLNGSSRVGHTFFATLPFQYTTEDGNTVPTIYLQWYRAGVAIPGATNNAYVAVAADLGKVLTLRLTAAKPGYVAYISNMSTSPVLIGDLGSAPVLYATTNLAPLTITGSLGSGITQTGVTYAYQWYRTPSSAPGVPTPIAGATLASYKPVAPADTGQLLSIKITVSKTAFTPFVTPLGGGAADYSVRGLGTPGIDNLAPEFHDEITAIPPSWLIGGSSGTPDVVSYQWLRNGAVIAGATGIAYDIEAAADRGAKLSVRITASHPGYLATTVVSPPTVNVPLVLAGTFGPPLVTKAANSLLLSVSFPAGTITTATPTLAYQWLSDGIAIPGAEVSTYSPVQPHADTLISVRVTATKAGYEPRVLTDSVGKNYSVLATGLPVISNTSPAVGDTLSVTLPTYKLGGLGANYAPTLAEQNYQWFVQNTPAGNGPTYEVQAADDGKPIYVQVQIQKVGWLYSVRDSDPTALVIAGP